MTFKPHPPAFAENRIRHGVEECGEPKWRYCFGGLRLTCRRRMQDIHRLSGWGASHRSGTSLVELLMFLAFFALCSGVLIGVLVSSSEQRTRQQTIAAVEQEGMQLLQMLTRRIRRAELISYPATGASISVLVLQLADEGQDPTVIALETGSIKVAEGSSVRTVSSNHLTISDLQFQNTSVSANSQSTTISFTITKIIPLPTAGTYSRDFESLVLLFPDHQRTGNGCGCSTPSCTDNVLSWGVCDGETCETSTESLPCS